MNPAWHKTQRGRIVYNGPPKPFTQGDAARVLRSVLDFNTALDDDEQTYRLFYFLLGYGFLPTNLKVYEKPIEPQLTPLQQLIKDSIYTIAQDLGVPSIAQTFAEELGDLIYSALAPDGVEYTLNSALVRLIKEARDAVIAEGRGQEWQVTPKPGR